MKIEIAFRDSEARILEYYLRKRYNSKAGLKKLAKQAIRDVVALQAVIELKEIEDETNKS